MTAGIAEYWLLLVLLGGAVLIIAFGLSEDGEVSRRVFGRFIFNIALPLMVIFGAALMLIELILAPDTAIWPAVIAGTVIAAGWLTTAIFSELGKARGRAEKLRDYHKALFAEIRDTLSSYYTDGHGEADGQAILQRMRHEPGFVPFVPKEEHSQIFRAIMGEIEVLPRQTIDIIVAYYSQINSVSALAEDMRGERFANLEQDRRIAIYEDYLQMRRRAFGLADAALQIIKEYSEKGPAAAEAKQRNFNSRDAAPNAPQREPG